MKILPTGLADALASGTTTLCHCWRIERGDAVVLGFTDHDRDISFAGDTYKAETGMNASAYASSLGLSVDTIDAHGALSDESLTEDDLARGLWDAAAVQLFRVDWSEPDNRVLMFTGTIGEVSRGPLGFRAELRAMSHELQQPVGRLYQFACDADLGDGRCKFALNDPAFKGTGTVGAVERARVFIVTGLDTFEADWFTRGLLSWTGGANNGLSMEVKLHSSADGIVTIELWQRMAEPILANDTFTVTAGCDKLTETCSNKFSNLVNFRGFPHIPGNDFAVSYPNSDDAANDGGSMFK